MGEAEEPDLTCMSGRRVFRIGVDEAGQLAQYDDLTFCAEYPRAHD